MRNWRLERSEVEELEPEESDHQQMEVGGNIRDKIQVEVAARGAIVRERMATRYNKRQNVEIFEVGDIISVGIPHKDRAKTDNKRLYCRIIAKPHPDRHQLLSKYGILIGFSLQRASPMLEHERREKITLANAEMAGFNISTNFHQLYLQAEMYRSMSLC